MKNIVISPIETVDLPDERPKEIIKNVLDLPPEYNIPYPFEPKFQGNKVSCFGLMMSEWYETIYNNQYRKELDKYLFDNYGIEKESILEEHRKFSSSFIYGNRNEDDYLGRGAIVRQQLQHCKDDGAVLSMEYESDLEMPELMEDIINIKDSLTKKSDYFKIKDFVRLKNIDEARLFMYNNEYPVISTINLYNNFDNVGKDGIIPYCDGAFKSRHGLLLNGWTTDGLIKGLNSYGISWGDNGYGYIHPDDEKIFSELWGIIPQDHIIFPEDMKKLWRVHIYSTLYREDAAKKANEFKNNKLSEYQKYILNTTQDFLDAIIIKTDDLFRVQVGAFYDKENAFKMVHALENMGYNNISINIRNPITEIIER